MKKALLILCRKKYTLYYKRNILKQQSLCKFTCGNAKVLKLYDSIWKLWIKIDDFCNILI